MRVLETITVAAARPRESGTPGKPGSGHGKGHGAGHEPPAGEFAGEAGRLRLRARERFGLLEQFATLIDSGIQVAPALASMRQQAPDDRRAAVLAALERSVVAGLPLSAAMQALPRAFPPLLARMVRAGEATGELATMLRRVIEALEAEVAMRSRLQSAMLYPAIMLTLTAGVVVFLLTCIVPRFEGLLRGKELPAPTRLLLAFGDGMRTHGSWLALAGLAATAGTIVFLRTARGVRTLDRLLLTLPVAGAIHRAAATARSVRTLGLLLQAGVPVHTALEHTEEVAGSPAYRDLWQRARATVIGGGTLRDALRGDALLGPTFEQMVGAGEATATLDKVMLKAAAQGDKELERRMRDLLTLVEPLMVVVMAVLVGFVALSIMMPVFQMSRT